MKIFILFFALFVQYAVAKQIAFTQEEQAYLDTNPTVTYSEIDWHPLSIIENNRMEGIMGDYLDLVTRRTGINFEYIPSKSWPEVLEKFTDKEIDLVPGIGSSPQEQDLGLVSKKYATYPMVIVTDQSYTFLESITALRGKTIAVPKNYTSYNFLINNYPKINILVTQNIPEALLKVKNKEADAFVGHIATSLFYLSKLYLSDLKIAGTTEFNFEHHYLIQKDNPLLLSIINKTFDSITHQERQKIYANWVQTTIVTEKINYTFVYISVAISAVLIFFFLYRQKLLQKYNKELEESYTKIEGILNATVEAVIIVEDGRCVDFNQSAQELFVIPSKKEGIGRDIFEFIDPNSFEIAKQNLQKEKTEPYEVLLLKNDKTKFPALVKGSNLKLHNRIMRVISVVDLSEIKEKEKLYIEQAKLASLGEMIGNIAHQWRQPLSVISTGATGLQLQKEYNSLSDEQFYALCNSINDNAQYLSKTIDDFRNFIKGDREKVSYNLSATIQSFLSLIDGSLKNHHITVVCDVDEKIVLSGYPNELIQCLMNIFNNSKDAFKNRDFSNDSRVILIWTQVSDKKTTIGIQDSAGGIDEKIIDKIFEPYFTTKHKSQGTGIGLHMTYNLIVNGMNGEIIASNNPFTHEGKEYKGALFRIILPS
jgi:signal transduction histidine kinase/ABC-type amino acid transport substrate-binding protein